MAFFVYAGGITYGVLIQHNSVAIMYAIILAAFLFLIYFTTGYTLQEKALFIQLGPIKRTIPYGEMRRVRKAFGLQPGPALSLDKLEIVYGDRMDHVFISPERDSVFLHELKQRCPRLKIEGVTSEIEAIDNESV